MNTETVGEYRVHPIASIFPMMHEESLAELADDIRENGLRESIVIAHEEMGSDEWVVIDGRNRYAACLKAGVNPIFVRNHSRPHEIGPWIISHNLHRRHMTASQRAAVAVEYEKVFAAEAEKRMKSGVRANPTEDFPEGSRRPEASDEAGDLFGVSGRSVRDAKYVAVNDPAEFDRVRRGETSVSGAAKRTRAASKPEPKRGTEKDAGIANEIRHYLGDMRRDKTVRTMSDEGKRYIIDALRDAAEGREETLSEVSA